MKQGRLFDNRPKRGKVVLSRVRDYDERNLASARLILEDVDNYGGGASGLVIWARSVVKRLESEEVHQ